MIRFLLLTLPIIFTSLLHACGTTRVNTGDGPINRVNIDENYNPQLWNESPEHPE